MDKAPDAFRTISEVAELLETPAHVLRFWESRFPQIKPVKRAGGRRYYRPADVALLSGIRQLLHSEGMTIRGVQKVLREQGVRHVASLGGADLIDLDLEADEVFGDADTATETPQDMGQVLSIEGVARRSPSDPTGAMPSEVQALFPKAVQSPPKLPDVAPPVHPLVVPREGIGGFLAFSDTPKPKPRPPAEVMPPAQATLPFDVEVPEALHEFVEDDADQMAGATVTPHAFAPLEDRIAGLIADEAGVADAVSEAKLLAQEEQPDSDVPPDTDHAYFYDMQDTRDVRPEGDVLPETEEPYFSDLHDDRAIPPQTDALPLSDALPQTDEPYFSDLQDDTAIQPESDEPPEPDETAALYALDGIDALSDPHPLPGDAVEGHLPTTDTEAPPTLELAGLATRLRALAAHSEPLDRPELAELHSRLGLLHAQMAEAVRLRR